MSDIIKRLRWHAANTTMLSARPVLSEAADEIERLRGDGIASSPEILSILNRIILASDAGFPDAVMKLIELARDVVSRAENIHGCDGCCRPPEG